MNLYQIVEHLRGRGFRVRQQGSEFRAQCPGHGGEDCNLALAEGANGGVVVTCHSHHCELPVIAAGAGLLVADFMPARPNGTRSEKEEATYPYRDEDGRVLFWVGRWPDKQFRQWREDAQGKRLWGLGETRRVLFGLPELLKTQPADLVAITEGEKDAVNVASLGVAATTNPHGAGRWKQEYTDWLREHLPGRRFVILPDNDEQGERHAEEVYESLKRAGLDVAVLRLPDLPPKGDVSDWIARGGTGEDLEELLKPQPHPLTLSVVDGEQLQKLDLPTPEALVPNLVYRGFSTLLAGDSKLGKSSLLLRMMLAMAVGGWWLDRDRREENRLVQSRVLFINFEDPLFLTRQRAERMMAPDGIPKGFLTMEPPYAHRLADIIDWLKEAKETFNLDAVVLDPIAVAAEWEKEDDNAKVALTFKALQRMASETQLAVLSAHHVTKKPGTYGANIRGASAIKGNVLGYLVLERDGGAIRLNGINKMTGEWDVTLGRSEHDYSWWIEESHSGHTRTPQQIAKQEAKADILGFLKGEPGATVERIADVMGLSLTTTRSYLSELEDAELIFCHDLTREPGAPGRTPRGWFAQMSASWGDNADD